MQFNNFFDPIFAPLLAYGPIVTIIVISIIISLIIVLATKFFTDQKLMKSLKEEQKVMQTELKLLKDDPAKFGEHQKKMMEKNWQYMKQSFKPTLITWIPLLLILGWVSMNLAYDPIQSNELFTVRLDFNTGVVGNVSIDAEDLSIVEPSVQEIFNNSVLWSLKANKEGTYIIHFTHSGQDYTQKVIISKTDYEQPLQTFKDKDLKSITLSNKLHRYFGGFNLFGWYPGWLATYIFISLIASITIRKIFKVH